MQKRKLLLPLLFLGGFCFCTTFISAQVELKLDAEKVLHRVDEKVYGHFLEHIYHSINGGLWGDLIWNRSFEDSSGGGQWSQTEDTISQSSMDTDIRLTFGEKDWSDFQFTLEAKKTGGAEGFLILFRSNDTKDAESFYWANLGGWSNTQHAVERKAANQQRQSIIGPIVKGSIENDRWYKIKVRCEGTKIEIFLDGEKIIEFTDERGPKSGQVGIGTWSTKAEFRNLKVESLDGKTLFEGLPEISSKPQISKHWEIFGDATAYLESGEALNGDYYQRIVVQNQDDENKKSGIQQRGITLKKDETYILTYWVKCDKADKAIQAGITTGLYTKDSPVSTSSGNFLLREMQWTQHRTIIKAKADVTDAVFRIEIEAQKDQTSSVCIDQISLMPLSWKETYGGMRPELLNAIAELRPPTIRWPGGCFASAYRWKSGIGAQHERVPYPFSIWDDREVNSFGTDEFIELCRRVGSEPIIVVNGGTRGWNRDRNPELANVDWPQEAADWVEYCNGPATSKWGSVRAKNGHPAPYNVKYWEVDNETQNGRAPYTAEVKEYIEIVRKTIPAMKKIDPTIKIAVAGSHYGPRLAWDKPIIDEVGEMFDYLSFHQYDDPQLYATGPQEIEKYFLELKDVISKSKNPNIKIYDSEWNAQSTDWRTGLYAGGILNMFERNGDILEIGGPALFLRHTIATAWDNAFVNFDNSRWFPAPNYVVMKLWRDHYAPNFLELTGDQKETSVVATKMDDADKIIIKAVNATNEPKDFVIDGFNANLKQTQMQRITDPTLQSRNTLEEPNRIAPQEDNAKLENGKLRFSLPPLSVGVVEVLTAISAEPIGPEKLQTELKKISDAEFNGKLEDYKTFAEKKGTALIEKADQMLALDGLTPENKRSAILWKYWGLVCRYGTDTETFEKERDRLVDSIEDVPEVAEFYKNLKTAICQKESEPFSSRKNFGDPKFIEAFRRWVEKYLPFFEKYYSEKDQPYFIGSAIHAADFLDPDGSSGLVLWTAEKLAPIAEKQKQSQDRMTQWGAEQVENSVRRVQMPGKEMVFKSVALDGSVVDVKDLRGKVVFLQFATTDRPGRIPDLIKLHNLLKDHGFVFLDHNIRDDHHIAQKKAVELGLPWTILSPDQKIAYELELENYAKLYACHSNAFLVGRDGKVIDVWSEGICPTLWKALEKQFPEQAEEIAKLAAEQEENERKYSEKWQAIWQATGFENDEKEKIPLLQELYSLFQQMNFVKRFISGKNQQTLELTDLILSSSELSSPKRNFLQIARADLLESLAQDATSENPDTNPAVFFKEMEKCVDELLTDSNVKEIFNHNLVFKKTTFLRQLKKYFNHVIAENKQDEKETVAKDIQDRYVKILEKETQHINYYGGSTLSSFSQSYIRDLEELNETGILESFFDAIIPIFEKAKDPELHEYAEKLKQRRMYSLGKELEFECVLMDGKTFNVKDLRGKIVLVNIWATWCGPCVREFPNMQKQYEKYKDRGYEMIAYSIDSELDDITKFQEEKKYPWLVGSQKLSEAQGMKDYYEFYGGSGVPMTFLLDRDGKVIFRQTGSNDEQINAALEKAFANTENKEP